LKKRPTYLYAIISVALVLFILGFFALTVLHARKLVALFKEKVDIWLELKSDTPASEATRIMADIRSMPFVKSGSVSFITKAQAAADMKADLGNENMPADVPDLLRDIVRFNVVANYLDKDSLAEWRNQLRQDTCVADMYLDAANTSNVDKNIENLGWITLGLGILLLFAAVTLIHNTIRLALYANRFVIKNQELVGASWAFISRPYIQRGIWNGLLSALCAIAALLICLLWAQRLVPDLRDLQDWPATIVVFVGLLLLGVLLSGLSTWYVVNKFLRMRLDELY
jgi:cell division transport system permease protein